MPRIVRISCLASGVLLLLHAFEWNIVDWLTPFLFVPVEGITWLVFIAASVASVVHWVRHRHLPRSWLPLLICCVTLGMVLAIPFSNLWLQFNFAVNREARERVVQQVLAGKLRSNAGYGGITQVISLPADAPRVSVGGNEILQEVHDNKTYIFFFTFRGILDSYAGFLFVPTGGDPRTFSDLNEPSSAFIRNYGEHWFYASHQ